MHRYHNNRRILVGDFALDKLASEVNETKFRSAVAVMRDFESAIRIKRILTGAYSCTPSYVFSVDFIFGQKFGILWCVLMHRGALIDDAHASR